MQTNQLQKLSQLLHAAQHGDRVAFASLLEHFHPVLSEQATQELGSTLDRKVAASDLVQDSLLDAYRHFQDFRGTTISAFKAWLSRILEHRAIDVSRHYRAASRDVGRETPEVIPLSEAIGAGPGASTIAQDREAMERVESCLSGLSEEERTIVLLRYRDELGFEEIATRMGIPRETVRRTWYAAIEAIGRQMGND